MIDAKACLEKLRNTKGLVEYLKDEKEDQFSRQIILRNLFAQETGGSGTVEGAVFYLVGKELGINAGVCPYFSFENNQPYCSQLKGKARCGISQNLCSLRTDQVPKY